MAQGKISFVLLVSSSEEITPSPTETVIEETFYEEVKTNPIVIEVEERFDAQPKKEYFELFDQFSRKSSA